MNNKKRKYSDIVTELNGISEEIHIKVPDYLHCDICNKRIYNYRELQNDFMVCSYDCYSILVLSRQNRYLHEKPQPETFLKKSVSQDALDKMEIEESEITTVEVPMSP